MIDLLLACMLLSAIIKLVWYAFVLSVVCTQSCLINSTLHSLCSEMPSVKNLGMKFLLCLIQLTLPERLYEMAVLIINMGYHSSEVNELKDELKFCVFHCWKTCKGEYSLSNEIFHSNLERTALASCFTENCF